MKRGTTDCDLCATTCGGLYVYERGNGHDAYTCDTCGHFFIDVDEDEIYEAKPCATESDT